MKSNEVINLELQLSTDQAEANTNKITTSIEDLEKNMCTAVNELTKVITGLKMKTDALISSVKQMKVPIAELAKSLNMITALDFNTLVTELSNLKFSTAS